MMWTVAFAVLTFPHTTMGVPFTVMRSPEAAIVRSAPLTVVTVPATAETAPRDSKECNPDQAGAHVVAKGHVTHEAGRHPQQGEDANQQRNLVVRVKYCDREVLHPGRH